MDSEFYSIDLCLTSCQKHKVLKTGALCYNFEIEKCGPTNAIFLKMILTVFHWQFHVNFKITFSVSAKKNVGESVECLRNIALLTILSFTRYLFINLNCL